MTEWPDCPKCESDVFVSKSLSDYYDYVCYLCDVRWKQSRIGGTQTHINTP